ncbi:MAG: NFACT family protein, partial [Thermoplasmatales archaeon]|nr:NFACT family protein [Thermoplasmatales archaeon]
MKRQLASFDIYMVVSELQELLGSYIDKIYQLTRDELLIRVNNRKIKQKESIFVRNGELICTTQKKFETPLNPTTFAMTLRKYILNGRITAITQHEFDRIINLKISKKEGEYALIIEFFSDGNIILANPDGKIILPLIKKHWAHRTIKSGSAYMPPPAQINPFNLSKDEFTDLLKKSEADLVRTLAVNVNLSGTYAEEICKRSGIERNTKIDKLTERDIEKVFIELSNFLELFKNKEFQPVLVKKDGKPIDILPFEFKSYENVDFEQVDRFTKNLQEFISIKKKTKKQEESNAEKKLGKLNRQLLQQQGAVDKLGEKIKQKKIEGELIYLNFKQCENLLNEITEVLEYKDKKEKIEKINEQELVKEFDPLSNMLVVYLPDIKGNISQVKLDFRKSVAENAEKAYNDSKKYRNKLAGARDSIEKTKGLIESAKKKVVEEKEKKKNVATGKTFWFESFRWFISSDGNIVVGGKNIKSNDKVVKKYLKDGDRYAHADIHGASSCIVKRKDIDNENLPISEKTLE